MPGASLYPFVVSSFPWEASGERWSLTVAVKATFSLAHGPGEPALAAQVDGPHEDVFFEQTPHGSLYSPTDFAPYKPRADILLVGHAYADASAPVESLVLRLSVGSFSKALRIYGERAWVATANGAQASAPRPFTRMPIRYERALRAGDNAVGPVAGDTRQPPPSIEVAREECAAETPGFGPIALAWRAHRDPRIGEALRWAQQLRASGGKGPAPAGLAPDLFNCAPRDQQVAEIAPGSPIRLHNLHPRSPILATQVPSLRPAVFHVDAESGAPREVATRLDTLWIDTDREVFVLTWRGVVAIAPPQAAGVGRVVVAAQAPGQRASFEEVDALVRGAARGGPAMPDKPSARRSAKQTVALVAMPEPIATPFPLAAPGASSTPIAPVAGAPWANVPAVPVPKPSAELQGTMPLGGSLQHLVPPPRVEAPPAAKRKAPVPATAVLQQMPADFGASAPFPVAAPGAPGGPASSEPVAGAPWAGVPAAPVPRPSKELEGTMPLGASLTEVVAQAKAIAAGRAAPASPPVIAADRTAPPVELPVVTPVPPTAPASAPPAAPVWRVDEPAAAPAPKPPPAAPPQQDLANKIYRDFWRKKR